MKAAADTWVEDAPVLADVAAASVDGGISLGPHRTVAAESLGTATLKEPALPGDTM